MKELTGKVLLAVAPVWGAVISIAVFQAARLPFPPALSWEALPQWGVFGALTYTCVALCAFLGRRVLG